MTQASKSGSKKPTRKKRAVAAQAVATPWVPPEGSRASSPGNRKSMQGNRSRDTKPELAVRSLLHAAGLRYRVARRPLPQIRRTADIVFGPVKVAVFIDGCYWHGCPTHGQRPKSNAEFWSAKIENNQRRDRETDALLKAAGWTVLRFWEHEPAADCAALVTAEVTARRQLVRSSSGRGPARRDSV